MSLTYSPSPVQSDLAIADRLAWLNDSPANEPGDYRPGWDRDDFEPTTGDDAWWLGFSLGSKGHDVEPPADYSRDLESAFRAGLLSGRDNFIGEMLEFDALVDEMYAERESDGRITDADVYPHGYC